MLSGLFFGEKSFKGSDVVLTGQDHVTERKTMSDRLVAITNHPSALPAIAALSAITAL
jgi:hypothetical protein